ncbi:hypothetical protein [Pseudazoarcus pumilus]|uniref:hypothetical protein n=1 Tax=Pseudazoarcus pumilus TaxID=2067960 RepID=UPI0018F8744A|nr:hypothetical protein [Pseudazoarcus pumilus]
MHAPEFGASGRAGGFEAHAGDRFGIKQMPDRLQTAGMFGVFPRHAQGSDDLPHALFDATRQEDPVRIRLMGQQAFVVECDHALGALVHARSLATRGRRAQHSAWSGTGAHALSRLLS